MQSLRYFNIFLQSNTLGNTEENLEELVLGIRKLPNSVNHLCLNIYNNNLKNKKNLVDKLC